jgi:hypothetical protein
MLITLESKARGILIWVTPIKEDTCFCIDGVFYSIALECIAMMVSELISSIRRRHISQ